MQEEDTWRTGERLRTADLEDRELEGAESTRVGQVPLKYMYCTQNMYNAFMASKTHLNTSMVSKIHSWCLKHIYGV